MAYIVSRKPTKSTGALRECRITLVRAKGQYLGRVEAPDAESAIKIAIAEFNVPEAPRSRLIAQKPSVRYLSDEKRQNQPASASHVPKSLPRNGTRASVSVNPSSEKISAIWKFGSICGVVRTSSTVIAFSTGARISIAE
jgi:hypothetical protein